MDLMQTIGEYGQGFSFGLSGTMIMIFIVVSIISIAIGVALFFMWRNSFNYKVKIYTPHGFIEPKKIEVITGSENKIEEVKKNNIMYDFFNFKVNRGKYIKKNGISYFQLMYPLGKKIEPIPNDYLYADGINLLKLSNDVFVPIKKPETTIEVGKNISLSILDENAWRQWNLSETIEIEKRFREESKEKKMIMMFIIGIVAIVIIGGLLFWLQYMSLSKGMFSLGAQLNSFKDVILTGSGSAPI